MTPPKPWKDAAQSADERELCAVLRRMADTLSGEVLAATAHRFNYVLVQRYTADAFLSFHRDKSSPPGGPAGQVHSTPVASISLGASRVFAFTKDAYDKRIGYTQMGNTQYGLELRHRDLLLMQASCNAPQADGGYAHALLRSQDEADKDAVRFNLTFRVMQSVSEGAHKSV